MEKNAKEAYPNFLGLFNEFLDGELIEKAKIRTDVINYTRAGYIYKILNALIISKPQIFASVIYDNPLLIKALLIHSYSKSVANIVQCLLISV